MSGSVWEEEGGLAFSDVPRTTIFTWNGVHVQEINLVNMERSKLDFVQKTLIKFL